jgi:predicted nucleotidyltransferase
MRLTSEQARTIRETVDVMFGPDTRVTLFGSRTDDSARGGDIDLFIEAAHPVVNRAAMASRLAAQLQLKLGDQRIDIVLTDRFTASQPIHDRARDQGVLL